VRDKVQERVAELTAEYRAGQQMLAELDAKRAEVQQTVLRISGALQVLNELLAERADAPADPGELREVG
jgi:hypothetical protein